MNLSDLSAAQLRRAATIKEQLENLQKELTTLLGAPAAPQAAVAAPKNKWKMSAAGRANVSAAAKARWAKLKGTAKSAPAAKPAPVAKPARKKWKISAAGKARIKAANQAYWAKVKAAKARFTAPSAVQSRSIPPMARLTLRLPRAGSCATVRTRMRLRPSRGRI